MPTIKDSLNADLSNYTPVPTKPPMMAAMPKYKINPFLRTVLPPFNSDPDTLRQFEDDDVPKIRVIPLPQSAFSDTSTTVISNTTASTSSSSGSSTSTVTLLPKTVVLNTPIVSPGSFFAGSVQMSNSFQLLSLSASSSCEVRLYGSSLAQTIDSVRPNDDPVPPEITQNIISCINLDSTPFQWSWQNRVGANQDVPQGATIYVTVINDDPAIAAAIRVTITYVPLET